jgi:hypothetical protein
MAELPEGLAHSAGVFPVVGGASIFGVTGADKGARLDSGHIGGFTASEVAFWPQIIVESGEGSLSDHHVNEVLGFFGGSVTPHTAVRF